VTGEGPARDEGSSETGLDSAALRREVNEHQWYHTLELAPGIVTPGWFDTRSVARELPIPASLEGRRCLDIGTFDGFWAFEMERRGASEVLAVDLLDPRRFDWPVNSTEATIEQLGQRKRSGQGFEVARRALGSSVRRVELSVYDLDPDDLGRFDFVYMGSLLLHLRDPVRALERVREVCAGTFLLVDSISLALSMIFPSTPVAFLDGLGRPWWWNPNLAGLERMLVAAGFKIQERPRRAYISPGAGQPLPRPHPKLLLRRHGREALVLWRRGSPHGAVLASPG
jgi:tRNA (mo5U34)-methyltransferase